jgi:hypothetical protein
MQNLRLILNPLKKLKKISYQKVINKNVNSCSQLCFAYNFLCEFVELFNEFEISLKFCTC